MAAFPTSSGSSSGLAWLISETPMSWSTTPRGCRTPFASQLLTQAADPHHQPGWTKSRVCWRWLQAATGWTRFVAWMICRGGSSPYSTLPQRWGAKWDKHRKYQEMEVTRNNHLYAKFKILNCECPCYVWAFAKSSALKIEMQVSCSISHKQAKAHIKKTIYSFYKYNTCTTALSHTLHPEDPTQYAT